MAEDGSEGQPNSVDTSELAATPQPENKGGIFRSVRERWKGIMGDTDPERRRFITAAPVREALQKTDLEKEENEKFLQKLNSFLTEKKISRRVVVAGGAVATAFAIDEFFLHGKGRYFLSQFASNSEFRDKLYDSLESGEFFQEDIPRLARDIVGVPERSVELSEKVDLHEGWLDSTFDKYEIRKLKRDGNEDEHLLLIADINKVNIVESEEVPQNVVRGAHVTDLRATALSNPNIAILPRTQMDKTSFIGADDIEYTQLTPRTWTSFQRSDGSIYEELDKDGTKNFRGGAMVLVGETLRVVDSSDLGHYQVGENCKGIQVCAYAVRSEHQEEDMSLIINADTVSGFSPNDPIYCSFVATFRTPEGESRTHLISIYNYMDEQKGEMSGAEWQYPDQLSVGQAVELCNQLKDEKGYNSFVLAVPDPDDFSAVVSTELRTEEEVTQLTSDVGFEINTQSKYYQPGGDFVRTLWSQPYTQIQIPRMFYAASK